MLCPKCDYISFDHITTCLKCDNDLSEVASLLNGTTIEAHQVNYLGVFDDPEQSEEFDQQTEVEGSSDFDEQISDEAIDEESVESEEMEVSEDDSAEPHEDNGFDPDLDGVATLDLSPGEPEESLQGDAELESSGSVDEQGNADESLAVESDTFKAAPSNDEVELMPTADFEEDSGVDVDLDTELPAAEEAGADLMAEMDDSEQPVSLETDEEEPPAIEMPEMEEIELDNLGGSVEETSAPDAMDAAGDSEIDGAGILEVGDSESSTEEIVGEESLDVTLDPAALSLDDDSASDSAGIEFEEGSASAEPSQDPSGQTGIDLGEIDLSDLVHAIESEEEPSDAETANSDDESKDHSSGEVNENDLSLSLDGVGDIDTPSQPDLEASNLDSGNDEILGASLPEDESIELSLESDDEPKG